MRSTHRLGIAGLVIALGAAPTAAQAAWLTAGRGSGAAQATTVNRGNAPSAARAAGQVKLTWQASTLASGAAVAGYDVIRHVAGGAETKICSYVTTTSCTDPNPVPGTVSYGVVPRVGTYWTGPESPATGFQYDVYTPTTTVTQRVPSGTDDSWANQDVVVTLAATDPGPVASGVASIHYTLNGAAEQAVAGATATVTVTPELVNKLTFWAVDKLGNAETAHGAQVKIDKTAPSSSGSLSGSTVTLSAKDEASGVAAVQYKIGSASGWTTYSAPFSLEPGKTVTFHAVDNAGNVESPDHAMTNIADGTPPSIAFVELVDGATYANNSGTNTLNAWSRVCGIGQICVTATDDSGVVSSVKYSLVRTGSSTPCWNGSGWVAKSGAACPLVSMTLGSSRYEGGQITNGNMKPGGYTATVTGTDPSGNTASISRSFSIE